VQNTKPESCYAHAKAPDEEIKDTLILAVYTKDDYKTNPNVRTEAIITKPGWVQWKTHVDRDCLSADPNDCISYGKKSRPEVIETVRLVKDTSITDDYKLIEKIVTTGYKTGTGIWTEVICEKDRKSTLEKLAPKLVELKYLQVPDLPSKSIFNALKAYQWNNNLPSGSLNLETLDALGIAY